MSAEISIKEVSKHKDKKSLWIVIHNQVYDVTKFLEEHPGGEDALLEYAGKDGTIAFEDVGHSDDARELLRKFKIGTLPTKERSKDVPRNCTKLLKSESKPWRTFDGSSGSNPKPKSDYKKPTTPRAERKCDAIVVPRESGSNLKWYILALAGAIIIGVAIKKYTSQ